MSTIPLAKERVLALVEAALRPTLVNVSIEWGAPASESELEREMVWLGDVTFEQEWGSLGRRMRTEEYAISLVAQVFEPGDDEKSAETRAWAMFALIEIALRSDPTLGNLLAPTAEIGAGTQTTFPVSDPEGWAARITVAIRCQARLQI